MGKHTPGPWSVRPDGIRQIIQGAGVFVAQTVGGNDEANARLIAAAPALYDFAVLTRDCILPALQDLCAAGDTPEASSAAESVNSALNAIKSLLNAMEGK